MDEFDDLFENDEYSKKLKEIPSAIIRALNRPGKPAHELTTIEGDPSQIKYANSSEWHSKSEVDEFVKNELAFTDEEWDKPYPSNGKSKAYDAVVKAIHLLREPKDPNEKPTIYDWNLEKKSGVWRLRKGDISNQYQNYFVLVYDENSKYPDIEDVEYHYRNQVNNSTKLKIGTKFILDKKENDQHYFVGHGVIGEIKELGSRVENVRTIKDMVARYSEYLPFENKILRTEQIQNKILCCAYPNAKETGKFGRPPSMIQINREIYDEILNQNPKSILNQDVQLPILTKDDVDKGMEKISKLLLVKREKIEEILIALMSGRHVLLAGPIGTGKTRLAQLIPEIFWENYGGYEAIDHTATSDWSTMDVIGGIIPKMNPEDQPIYVWEKGCVVDTILKNSDRNSIQNNNQNFTSNMPRGTWLIIDEFNRADIDKAFGPLFTALRTRKLKIGTNSKNTPYKEIQIPKDYRIIGTLNTADKHFLFNLSDALKSRFAYIEIDSPSIDEWEQEIFYSLKNALTELELKSNYVVFNDESKKINIEKTDNQFYELILEAYEILKIIRIFKELGPAILKLIYQGLIISKEIGKTETDPLDISITSNLIPQIENESELVLGTIHAIFSNNLIPFMKEMYHSINRENYQSIFIKILEYIQLEDIDKISKLYENNELPTNSEEWDKMSKKWDSKKNETRINTKLKIWTKSLNILRKTKIV